MNNIFDCRRLKYSCGKTCVGWVVAISTVSCRTISSGMGVTALFMLSARASFFRNNR